MSSVQHVREFIKERLTAAAEKIFTEFERTIVQYEEELDRQSRLLALCWKPQKRLNTELPQQSVCKKKVLTDQLLCDQEEPEPAQAEDQEDLCTNQDVEHLVLKEECDTLMETFTFGEDEQKESESNSNWLVPEGPDQKEDKHVNFGSARSPELKPKTRDQRNRSDGINVQKAAVLESHRDSGNTSVQTECFRQSLSICSTGEKSYSCSFCGKEFKQKKKLTQHIRTHTDERPYSCKWCEKSFHQSAHLIAHRRIHTGERPYPCSFCDKRFRDLHTQKRHIRSHTGERPYSCETCGESFPRREYLLVHMRTHSG